MTTPYLRAELMRDEGLRLTAYPDPLTGARPWTIGYGHTGPDVRRDSAWTQAQAEDALAADIAGACRTLDRNAPWWRALDDARQDVLANMAFNLGWGGLSGFQGALAAIRAGDWQGAHDAMLASAWARQVGARARRLATQMLTGERTPA